MSHLSQLRKAWNYETNIPRCSTCDEFLPPRVYLKRDSLTAQAKPICKAGHFHVAPLSVCDKWHRKGEVLDAAHIPKTANQIPKLAGATRNR